MASIKRRDRKKTYFFSDVHLGLGSREDERKKELHLVRFLDAVRIDAREIFIVGDLFDYWFEYQSVVPKGYVRLLGKLAVLTDSGVGVSYLAGNHDFWMKNYLSDELGISLFAEPVERVIDGRKFYIHHGDGLLKNDTGYRILKRILRNRLNISLFSLVHPDVTSGIARWSSRKSRAYTGKREYEGNDMVEFAEKKIREGYDYVIMGHNHVSQVHRIGEGVYINLGEWITERSYAVFDGKKLTLKRWNR